LLPICLGDTYSKERHMIETTVDYWTCIDLAEALEQTMRNDLWATAERIVLTASRITVKPDELLVALKKYEVRQAALSAASDVTVKTFSQDPTTLSRAG
jgi:hypothetical protein